MMGARLASDYLISVVYLAISIVFPMHESWKFRGEQVQDRGTTVHTDVLEEDSGEEKTDEHLGGCREVLNTCTSLCTTTMVWYHQTKACRGGGDSMKGK
jgi:hypothetical protein